MAGYFMASYDVSNADTYAKYNPGSLEVIMGTVAKHAGKVLVATDQATWIAGERKMVVIMEFPTVEAAQAWLDDEDYGKVKGFRIDGTSNRFEVIAPQFVPPAG